MDSQFWIKAWNEGRTNFHQKNYNDKLMKYFPQLNPQKGQRVLVPLCGKSKDLLWLRELGLNVHGVELYDQVAQSFFDENKLSIKAKANDQNFIHYTHDNLTISSGDFFKLNETDSYDLIYDRASLVALPKEMRSNYAQVITNALKKGGAYLLISFEYDQSQLDGPPFSVKENEVRELYEDHFSIELKESERALTENPRFATMGGLEEKVYILKKRP